MHEFMPIEDLGRRTIILGPTNAGKSTLAVALGNKLGVPTLHIDLFRHLPNTDWKQRPDEEFAAIHDAAIAGPEWVMDGNYTKLLPQRLARATGIIVVDDHLWRRYWRYFRRTLGHVPRAGALEGNRDSIKWAMIQWLWRTRNAALASRRHAIESGLPYLVVQDQTQLQALYKAWDLSPTPF
ncbi:AAA family ATPase [Devosia marina]|uniref:AAA family ATPase n=1 Tax=Devosia marina TaxID=2683198 RepID=A0A7X3FR38_9HYPH|nr:AAA family ATPase [Devosia marina]MVS98325.1 AAA family ATPase [Devosia marina]